MEATKKDSTANVTRRIVLKIGSSSVTGQAGSGVNETNLAKLVLIASEWIKKGCEVIIVSSGAIAAGLQPLNLATRPKSLEKAQAAAAVGQGILIAKYNELFSRENIVSAQVLITLEDIIRRSHYLNIQSTLKTLIELNVIPIINENDSVGTHEIKLGDNDRIAALVAHLVSADELYLITDVNGLYDRPPKNAGAKRIESVSNFSQISNLEISGVGDAGVGSGGMLTKVEAARIATSAGIQTTLTNLVNLDAALHGANVGTKFFASHERKPSRLFWLEHAATVMGKIFIDAGAANALTQQGKSLLPVGVLSFEGTFAAGETVEIFHAGAGGNANKIARGVIAFDSQDLANIIGKNSSVILAKYGADFEKEVVHRDDLVILT